MSTSLARIGALSIVSATLISTGVWAIPPLPTGFVANDATDCGVVRLSWDPLVAANGVKIYRDGQLIAIAGPAVTSHLDYEMAGPGTYTYCLGAFDAGGTAALVCDGATLPASPVSIDPWDWYNDVFPSAAGIDALVGTAAFDKTTAVLVTGHNLAPCPGGAGRAVMPDDKVTITVTGAVLRVDMIFRIEPGPGNYCVTGAKGSGLDVPPGGACVAAVPGDGTFWGSLMAAPGIFATPGAAALHAAAPSGWDKNVWNSRQCEAGAAGVYQTTDFAAPGVHILPDGLFCPGTHVEYYFRMEFVGGSVVNVPDPNCVIQKKVEGSIDGHRWAEFSVLPDRWKDAAWAAADRHAVAPACMLVVDLDDGRGNERSWTGVADSTGATLAPRYGANNGWRAVGGPGGGNPIDVDDPANNRRPDGTVGFVDTHGGSAGTTWDLYNVRGAQYHCEGNAGSLGSRAGVVPVGFNPPGPTGFMLRYYYRSILLLTGDRSSVILGPLVGRSQNDTGLLTDFLSTAAGSPKPRALLVEGSGFAEAEFIDHPAFLAATFNASFVADDYRFYSVNAATATSLIPSAPFAPPGRLYGVVNVPPVTNEVLGIGGGALATVMAAKYADTGFNPNPKIASLYTPNAAGPPHDWISLLSGWNIEDLGDATRATSAGRLFYHWDVLNTVLASVCPTGTGGPVLVGEDEIANAPRVDFLRVKGNPPDGSGAVLELGLAEAAQVDVGVFDIAGRLVRRVHEGALKAGPHSLAWDGTDETGRPVSPGVYLVRARNLDRGTIVGTKLTLLR